MAAAPTKSHAGYLEAYRTYLQAVLWLTEEKIAEMVGPHTSSNRKAKALLTANEIRKLTISKRVEGFVPVVAFVGSEYKRLYYITRIRIPIKEGDIMRECVCKARYVRNSCVSFGSIFFSVS